MGKILVAVDASASFTSDDTWPNVKKIVNETIEILSRDNEVVLAKFSTDVRVVSLDEFNLGWDFTKGDGGGTYFEKVLAVVGEYDKVLVITDGYLGYDVKGDQVALMILPDPDYSDQLPIVDFLCEHCGNERGKHRSTTYDCPVKGKKSEFSTKTRFSIDPSKPLRKRTI